MGAFFLTHTDASYDLESVKTLFQNKGFNREPMLEDVGNWRFWYYPKQEVEQPQYVKTEASALYVIGTHFRKGKNLNDSLQLSLSELENGMLDGDDCIGGYGLVYFSTNGVQIFLDPGNLQNVFASRDKKIFSSSFLAVCFALDKRSINTLAATEVLTTGSLIGPDTLVNEVVRIEPESPVKQVGLEIGHQEGAAVQKPFKGTYQQAIDYQIEVLKNYLKDTTAFAKEQGVDAGVTSGHDSRLLLALMRKQWKGFHLHSHYRIDRSIELEIAEELAGKVNVSLHKEPVRDHFSLSGAELLEVFEQSYLFCDGLIRMHGYWMEEYNTANHRRRVLQGHKLGLSGIGGEQYRNADNLVFGSYNLRRYIEYRIVKNISGSCFSDTRSEQNFLDHLESKIRTRLGISNNHSCVNKTTVKRYLNEVFIPARLGGRNNAENQLSFFLSPFVEDSVAKAAYEIISFLGPAQRFQQDMIKRIDPELALVNSDYGYNFYKGEGPVEYVKGVLRGVMPYKLNQKRLDARFQQAPEKIRTYMRKLEAKELLDRVMSLQLPLKWESLLNRPDVMPLVLDLGYLMKKLVP